MADRRDATRTDDAEVPLYRRVVDALRQDIVSGHHAVGDRLPTEDALCRRFGVSRHTVREALRALREEGLVASRQGAGTTVVRRAARPLYTYSVSSIEELLQYATEARYAVDKSGIVVADRPLAERLGCDVGFFHGRLNAKQREELLAAFAREDGPSVLVISIRAGGRGLNLPAANHVFHFDRWWNPAVEQQATDRAYRFGQRKHVHVHSLICSGTLEERIDALLDSKRELAEKVIAGRSEDWLGDLDLGAIRAAVELSLDAVEEEAA